MNKCFAFLAIVCLVLLSAHAGLAGSVEIVSPKRISNGIIMTDYGFAAADSDNIIRKVYGCKLEKDEQADMEASGYEPCFYCQLYNDTDEAQEIRLYIKGGRKFNVHWDKRVTILPHEDCVYSGGGIKTAATYRGTYSVDITGKKADILRFELTME